MFPKDFNRWLDSVESAMVFVTILIALIALVSGIAIIANG